MKPEEVALHNCEREPVHRPNQIQSFSGLLAYDLTTLEVSHVSENLGEIFGSDPATLIGKSFLEACSSEVIHEVRNATGLSTVSTQRERIGEFTIGERLIDVGVYVTGETAVVEFEPVRETRRFAQTPISRIRSLLARLETGSGIEELLQSATEALRQLTGFDRVMGYRFLHDAAGEVVAEARSPSVDPYLGLRYPASDIPSPVRDLMVRVPFRVISDIKDSHSSIVSSTDRPLDLSQAHSRGVSPIHVEYLTNMGVRSTMNTSIIVHGQLWGLFAFHHTFPNRLTPDQRSIVETIGHFVSLQIQQKLEQEQTVQTKRVASTLGGILASEIQDSHVLFQRFASDFLEMTNATGAALVNDRVVIDVGEIPSEERIFSICDNTNDEVLATNQISSIDGMRQGNDEQAGGIAGVLSLRLDRDSKSYLCFYRPETIAEVRWGGNPEKKIEHGPNGPRLSPRNSFDVYRESVRKQSVPWSPTDVRTALEIRAVFRQLTESKNKAANQAGEKSDHRDLLIAELNHRVQNILALVRSVARQTKDSSQSLEMYATAFEKRVTSLSAAHDLIGSGGLQWARLSDLVETELDPYIANGKASITTTGDPVALKSDVAPLMALVIHELATNAAKHGAFACSNGSLAVSWKRESGGLMLRWRETVDRKVEHPTRLGFGLSLIRRAVPYECRGECKLNFEPDGLSVEFWIPNTSIKFLNSSSELQSARRAVAEVEPPSTTVNIGRSRGHAVVVEDNMVLAMELEQQLLNIGFGSVRAFADQQSCLQDDQTYDANIAILDINLGDTTSYELADKLVASGVPLLFASGYRNHHKIPEGLAAIPRLTKPIDQKNLEEMVQGLLKDCP